MYFSLLFILCQDQGNLFTFLFAGVCEWVFSNVGAGSEIGKWKAKGNKGLGWPLSRTSSSIGEKKKKKNFYHTTTIPHVKI